jgi:MurNAc alpha-1-phosphate uridylyltransferase
MRAMILAAGRGERLRPHTDTTPKPLLKVGQRRLIEYQIVALKKAGVEQVVVNVSWLAEKIRSVLGHGDRYGVEIIYSDESDRPLETAGGIVQALPMLGSEPFIVCNADVWTEFDYATLKPRKNCLAHLVLVANPAHHPEGDFSLRGQQLVKRGKDALTYSGIGIYRAEFFAGLTLGKRALAPLLNAAIENNLLSGEIYRGVWYDIGTTSRLDQLKRYLAKL